jgi:hypothetical protein
MVFYFPNEEERQPGRQVKYITEEVWKLSDYVYRWNQMYILISYISYDTAYFTIMCYIFQIFTEKAQTHVKHL